jgi:hypothetical protein
MIATTIIISISVNPRWSRKFRAFTARRSSSMIAGYSAPGLRCARHAPAILASSGWIRIRPRREGGAPVLRLNAEHPLKAGVGRQSQRREHDRERDVDRRTRFYPWRPPDFEVILNMNSLRAASAIGNLNRLTIGVEQVERPARPPIRLIPRHVENDPERARTGHGARRVAPTDTERVEFTFGNLRGVREKKRYVQSPGVLAPRPERSWGDWPARRRRSMAARCRRVRCRREYPSRRAKSTIVAPSI